MIERTWSLPMNRSELIARCEQLEATLREAKLQCGTWKRIAERGLGLTPETPPHLRGPIIQAHADTNGVPPSSEPTGNYTDSIDVAESCEVSK